MEEPRIKLYLRIVTNFILMLLGLLVIIFAVPRLLKFFLPFVIAFLISSVANPLVRFMERKIKIVRKHGSVIIIVLVLGAVVGIFYAVGALIVHYAVSLYEDRFVLYDQFSAGMNTVIEKLNGVFDVLPESVQEFLTRFQSDFSSSVEGFLSNIELPSLATAGSYVMGAADVLLMVIITILAAYFLIAERDNIAALLVKILPKSFVEYYNLIVSNFKKAVGGYFKAQFKIMLILTVIMFIGFEIMDISYSFLIAFLIAFLDFLPVFGTGTVFWPWIVVDLISGEYTQAIFLGILYLICQLVRQILQPKMVGDSVGMDPLATLVFMFVGYRLGGVLGLILGIPIGMALVSFYQAGAFDRLIRGFRILAKDINDFRKY